MKAPRQHESPRLTGCLKLCAVLALLCWVSFLTPAAAQQLPAIEGESLSGHKVVLPDAADGKIAVLVLGFSKSSKGPTTAWAKKIHEDFADKPDLQLYQLPVLESVPRFVRGFVISSMRKDVPANMRDGFVPVLHGEAELKKLVNYKETDDAYLIVLDRSGKIVHQRHGPFAEASYAELRSQIEALVRK